MVCAWFDLLPSQLLLQQRRRLCQPVCVLINVHENAHIPKCDLTLGAKFGLAALQCFLAELCGLCQPACVHVNQGEPAHSSESVHIVRILLELPKLFIERQCFFPSSRSPISFAKDNDHPAPDSIV